MATHYIDDELKPFRVKSFAKGYNSYTQSNTLLDDQEIPQGRGPAQNVYLDQNAAASKRAGSSKFSAELSTGHAVFGAGLLKNTSFNKPIFVSNTTWYAITSGTSTALTGVSFTADKDTDFCQAIDRLYGANGTDNLAYTNDASTLTAVSSNGNIGRWPVSYNRRLYMTNTTNPDRIYYSNPYGIDLTNAGSPVYSTTYFGTFDTDLTTAISGGNKKNAGFIILLPGGGVEITRLMLDNTSGVDYIYAYTKRHGIWRISYASTNTDGTIVHNVQQVNNFIGSPAGRSIIKVSNDQWFYSVDNIYTLGEVAQYINIRTSPKAGRVQSEINSIANSGRTKVSAGFFKNKIYFAYMTGTYNDRILVYDTVLNAWSTPFVGINASCFLVWEDDNSAIRFLAGSSNSGSSFIYELETGTSDAGTAISSNFTTKSFDCDLPGLIKRFAFVDVFYSLVYGVLTYEVFLDETSSVTGALQLGSSSTSTSGIGSQPVGNFPVGGEYSASATTALRSGSFRIDCGYAAGKTISIQFTNNNTGEQFKINSLQAYFIEGEIYEQ